MRIGWSTSFLILHVPLSPEHAEYMSYRFELCTFKCISWITDRQKSKHVTALMPVNPG